MSDEYEDKENNVQHVCSMLINNNPWYVVTRDADVCAQSICFHYWLAK